MGKSTLLAHRYRISREIGRGGMGTTYLARDIRTEKDVAVKMLHLRNLENWKTLELFDREARTLKNLDHPAIPDYIDYFSVETDDGPSYYLVQEYIKGTNLENLVAGGKRFTDAEVKAIAKKLLGILSYLHGMRPPVIHRDINPRNVILTKKNELSLVDFGSVCDAVRSLGAGGSTIVGTYGYMPPEQMMGTASPASDLYAVGTTLIFLLSHKKPGDIPVKHLMLDYRPFVKTSPVINRFIDACIQPDVSRRVATAEDALAILEDRTPSPAAVTEVPYGSRMRVTRDSEFQTSIVIRGNLKKSLTFLGFSAFWYLVLVAWTSFALSFAGLFWLFSIPFWAGGLILPGRALSHLRRQTIVLTPEELILKKRFPFRSQFIPLQKITEVKVGIKEEIVRTKDMAAGEDALVITAGAQHFTLWKNLGLEEIRWLSEFVKGHLRRCLPEAGA